MQRRWLLVAMFHSSSRLLPHTVYAKSYLLWYILYICACCRFNGDACLSETSDHHRREETVKRGVARLPGHDTGSSYFGSWVSVEASQKQRKSSKAPFKKINKGESYKASYLASTRQKKWRKKKRSRGCAIYVRISFPFLSKERRERERKKRRRREETEMAIWSMTGDTMEIDRDAHHLL